MNLRKDYRKAFLYFALAFLLAAGGAYAATYFNGYGRVARTGGAANALDGIDGDDLADKYIALVPGTSPQIALYILDADSAAGESDPDVISPDANPGNQRWLLMDTILGTVIAESGAEATPSITTYGDLNTGMWFPAADTVAFSEGGSEAMRIDSEGDVGIGTTTPHRAVAGSAKTLDMSSADFVEIVLDHTDGGAGDHIADIVWARNNDPVAYIKGTHDGATDSAKISMYTQPTGGALTERFVVYSDGDIEFKGKTISATTTVTAAGPTDNLDVSGVNVIFVDTNGNNVTIGGMTGGESGQVLQVVVIDAGNNSILENAEGTGNQDIYLNSGGDETLTAAYGGWTLVCNGTHWYEVDN